MNKVPHFQEYPLVYTGKRFNVHSVNKRDVVVHPGSVVILPLLNEKEIVLIRNERFAVRETLLELPAGTLEANEKPLECAKRELEEEIGYRAGEIHPLTQFYTTPGFCNEVMHAYVANKLVKTHQKLDEGENITIEVVSIDKALEMALGGQIKDGKTLATLLFYGMVVREKTGLSSLSRP